MDRAVWKLVIHVPEPWVGYEILWVSPLAYPNLFGTKGFLLLLLNFLSSLVLKLYYIDITSSTCDVYC
jgi:hypothetical protein